MTHIPRPYGFFGVYYSILHEARHQQRLIINIFELILRLIFKNQQRQSALDGTPEAGLLYALS